MTTPEQSTATPVEPSINGAADADEALLQIVALQKGRHAGPDCQRLLAAMQRGKMALIRDR